MLFSEAEVRAMKRILAVFVAASVCGCSAGLMQAESTWTGSRVPAGAGDFMVGDEEAGGFGRFAARLGWSFYLGAEDAVDPRFMMGFGYIMPFDFGDVEVGLDIVPDWKYWFDNVYYNLRGDYIYWLGETGLALTGGLGFFMENNPEFDGTLKGSFFVHMDIGALYLINIKGIEFDGRLALQIPFGGDKLNVGSVVMLCANYAF